MGCFCCAFLKEQRGERGSEDASQQQARLWTGSSLSRSLSLSLYLSVTHTRARTQARTRFPHIGVWRSVFFIFPIGRDTLLNALLLYIPALREISGKDKQSEGVGGVQAVCQSLRPDWRLRVALRCDPFRGNSCEQSHDPDGESEA